MPIAFPVIHNQLVAQSEVRFEFVILDASISLLAFLMIDTSFFAWNDGCFMSVFASLRGALAPVVIYNVVLAVFSGALALLLQFHCRRLVRCSCTLGVFTPPPVFAVLSGRHERCFCPLSVALPRRRLRRLERCSCRLRCLGLHLLQVQGLPCSLPLHDAPLQFLSADLPDDEPIPLVGLCVYIWKIYVGCAILRSTEGRRRTAEGSRTEPRRGKTRCAMLV